MQAKFARNILAGAALAAGFALATPNVASAQMGPIAKSETRKDTVRSRATTPTTSASALAQVSPSASVR